MKCCTSLIFIICGIFILFLLTKYDGQSNHRLEQTLDVNTPAQKGLAWLKENHVSFRDPGIPWVIYEIKKNYCPESEELEKFAFASFEPFKTNSSGILYSKLLQPEYHVDSLDEKYEDLHFGYDGILIPSLYCKEYPLPELFTEKVYGLINKHGYDLTHVYLALTWLNNNNCSNDRFENARNEVAKKIADEHSLDAEFGDLYAERVAFLLYGGHSSLVKEEWIDKIIQSASQNGGWYSDQGSDYFGEVENPHTTILATWALTLYSNKCPL